MAEKDILQQKNELNQQDLIRRYSLGTSASLDDVLPYQDYLKEVKPTDAELERFKNASTLSRVWNHLWAGATMGLYNPYKVPADVAEQENWMYKRFIRIPFIEDLVSPYGFSVAGLIESLPILAYGKFFKGLGKLAGAVSAGEKIDKTLSIGIRVAENIGVSALNKTFGMVASKIPAVEKAWMSLSPATRKIGYEIVKKDLMFSPWVAGATYREKSLRGEDASRLNEYISALYNPVNLLFAAGFAGLELRAMAKPLMSAERGFIDAIGEIQKLEDLRRPMVASNFANLLKDALVEKNPIALKSLISYADNVGGFLDADTMARILNEAKISQETKKLLTRDGLFDYLTNLSKSIPDEDFIASELIKRPELFLREEIFKDPAIKEKISQYTASLAKINDLAQTFFDDVLSINKPVMDILKNNLDVADILSKKELSPEDKLKIVDLFLKQKDLSNYLRNIPEFNQFFTDIAKITTEGGASVGDVVSRIRNLSPEELNAIKNQVIKPITAIVPLDVVSVKETPSFFIPKDFVSDVLNSVASRGFITPEGLKNLVRSGEIRDFLQKNTTPETFAKIVQKYPEYLRMSPEEANNVLKSLGLASVEQTLKTKPIPEKVKTELVEKVKEVQKVKNAMGIEIDEAIKASDDVRLIMTDLYSELSKFDDIINRGEEIKTLLKDYISNQKLGQYYDVGGFLNEGFGELEKLALSLNLWKGKISQNPKLMISKISSEVLHFMSPEAITKKAEIAEYYLGKRKFDEVSAFKDVWNNLKEFGLVKDTFNEKNFIKQVSELPDKIMDKLGKETKKRIFDAKEFINEEFEDYLNKVFTNASPEEVGKIIENQAKLKSNVVKDELRNENNFVEN